MIIIYEIVQSPTEKNIYKALPISVHRCCTESILWFFKYSVDCIVKDAILLKRNKDVVDKYSHCQFCGAKHEFYTTEEFNNIEEEEKIK